MQPYSIPYSVTGQCFEVLGSNCVLHILATRFETCYQIALAIKKEVEDLEAAGIQVSFFLLIFFFLLRFE